MSKCWRFSSNVYINMRKQRNSFDLQFVWKDILGSLFVVECNHLRYNNNTVKIWDSYGILWFLNRKAIYLSNPHYNYWIRYQWSKVLESIILLTYNKLLTYQSRTYLPIVTHLLWDTNIHKKVKRSSLKWLNSIFYYGPLDKL